MNRMVSELEDIVNKIVKDRKAMVAETNLK